MRRLFVLLLICAAGAAAYFAADGRLSALWRAAPPPLRALEKDAVILAFGDSITFGYGATEPQSYPAQLSGLIQRRVVRAGFNGLRSAGALLRLPRELESHRPQLVILCIGGNDILRKLPPQQTADNIRKMIDLIRAAGAQVLLVSMPRRFVAPISHPMFAEIAAEKNVWLEEAVMKEVLFNNALKSDLIHPNAAGYRRIAEAMAAFLRRAGAV